jgi:hypothetical protein
LWILSRGEILKCVEGICCLTLKVKQISCTLINVHAPTNARTEDTENGKNRIHKRVLYMYFKQDPEVDQETYGRINFGKMVE